MSFSSSCTTPRTPEVDSCTWEDIKEENTVLVAKNARLEECVSEIAYMVWEAEMDHEKDAKTGSELVKDLRTEIEKIKKRARESELDARDGWLANKRTIEEMEARKYTGDDDELANLRDECKDLREELRIAARMISDISYLVAKPAPVMKGRIDAIRKVLKKTV